MEGRLASNVHRLNYGLASGSKQKLAAVGVKLSAETEMSLTQIGKQADYQKHYAKKAETVKKCLVGKHQHLRKHLAYKKKKCFKGDYKKGQLDPVANTSNAKDLEHSYSQKK